MNRSCEICEQRYVLRPSSWNKELVKCAALSLNLPAAPLFFS